MNLHPDSIESLLIAASTLKDEDGNKVSSLIMYEIFSQDFLNQYVRPIDFLVNKILKDLDD
jgi:phosphoribosylpyrophosphate synthetase